MPICKLARLLCLRAFGHSPLRVILATACAGLGVALFLGIEVIHAAALDSARKSVEAIAGKADIVVESPAGLDQSRLREIVQVQGVGFAIPRIKARAMLMGEPKGKAFLTLVGIDMVKESMSRNHRVAAAEFLGSSKDLLLDPDSIVLTRQFAGQHDLHLGERIELSTPSGSHRFLVRGVLDMVGVARAYGGAVALIHLPTAQTLYGRPGMVDEVDILVEGEGEAEGKGEGDTERIMAELRQLLGAAARVHRPALKAAMLQASLGPYQDTLSLFSALALFAGMLIVMGSVDFHVAQRSHDLAVLRILGATRRAVFWLVASEGLVIGLLASLLGFLMAGSLARTLCASVEQSLLVQLGEPVAISELGLGLGHLLLAIAVGGPTGLLGALYPAYRAMGVEPRAALQQDFVGRSGSAGSTGRSGMLSSLVLGSAALLLVGLSAWLHLSLGRPWVRLANALAAIVGVALLSPPLVRVLLGFGRIRTVGGLLIGRRMAWSPGRLLVSMRLAGLALALVVLLAGVLESLKGSIGEHFQRTLPADLVVGSRTPLESRGAQPMREDLRRELVKAMGLQGEHQGTVMATRGRLLRSARGGLTLQIRAVDEPPEELEYGIFQVLGSQARDQAREAGRELFHAERDVVFVSESLAEALTKKPGDQLELQTVKGLVSFEVIAIVKNPGSPYPTAIMDRRRYKKYWQDSLVDRFDLCLAPGQDPVEVKQRIEERLGRLPQAVVLLPGELRRLVAESMDDAFAFARIIEVWLLLLAGLGMAMATVLSIHERQGELALLRAIGMSRRRLRRMLCWETAGIGLGSAVVAILLGSILASIWTRYSLGDALGWRADYHFPWAQVPMVLGLGAGLGAVSALVPALMVGRLQIASALRCE